MTGSFHSDNPGVKGRTWLKHTKPSEATNATESAILFPPNLSIRNPTIGAAILPSNCPKEKARES